MVEKNKFTKKEWDVLKYAVGGFKGELHHLAGKQYEYLNLILPLSSEEHRGKTPARNYKYPDNVPHDLICRASNLWVAWLSLEEMQYFYDKGLIYES